MSTSNLASVIKISPSLSDIINLPVGQLTAYMAATTTVGLVYHIGVVRAIRWARRKAGYGSVYEIRDETPNPRFVISSGLKSVVLFGAAFLFEAIYIRFPVLPKIVAGVVWGSRKLVGLPGDAPYGELSGGGPVANVLAVTFEIERLFCSFVPFPVVGSLGLGVKGMTPSQLSEVFKPLVPPSSADLPMRFMTPTRLVRTAMQVGFATAVGALVHRYIVPKILGAPNRLREPSNLPTYLACPFMFLTSLAIVRDNESISFLGTRFRLDIVSLALLLLLPSCVLMEVLVAHFTNPPLVGEEESTTIMDNLSELLLGGLPVRHMSKQEASQVQENLFGTMMNAIYFGDTAAFAGSLAVLTSVVVTMNNVHSEPLTAYENALERLNADIGDAVFERQASIESVQDDSAETCPICLRAERPVSQDMLRIKACKHEFHTECLSAWLEQSTECPLCRSHIDRQLSEEAERIYKHWCRMPDEIKDTFMGRTCMHAADLIYDMLSLAPKPTLQMASSHPRSAALYMTTVDDMLKILEGTPSLNLDQTSLVLLATMTDVLTELLQGYASPTIATVEDMLCMMIAPCTPDPLFPGTFNVPTFIASLPPTTSRGVYTARRIMMWMHFHF